MNFLKSLLTKLATLFGRWTSSMHSKLSSITKTNAIQQSPILTNHFKIKYEEESNPQITTIYNRAFALIKRSNDRFLNASMFCYRSGDWYILEVNLSPLFFDGYERTTDVGSCSRGTREVYVLDMIHDRIIQKDDFDALKTVFETLKTRKPHHNDNEERKYLYHITTILLAAAEPGSMFIEPHDGQHFPEEVDFPKYEIQGETLIYNWFELSGGMAYSITKHTIIWDGKTATHQKTEIDMSAPQKLWRKPDKPWK